MAASRKVLVVIAPIPKVGVVRVPFHGSHWRWHLQRIGPPSPALLADPDADLNDPLRRRWEGALAALEAVLGERSSLVDNEDVRSL